MEATRQAQHGRPSNVLLVEDEPSVRLVLSRWLTESGRHVVACPTFQEAKDYLAAHTPDVLVTDIRLRDYNGLQLVMQLAEKDPDALCIVITGHDDSVLRKEAHLLRACYLMKPVERADFLAALENLPSGRGAPVGDGKHPAAERAH